MESNIPETYTIIIRRVQKKRKHEGEAEEGVGVGGVREEGDERKSSEKTVIWIQRLNGEACRKNSFCCLWGLFSLSGSRLVPRISYMVIDLLQENGLRSSYEDLLNPLRVT